jgi:hypothetical protein
MKLGATKTKKIKEPTVEPESPYARYINAFRGEGIR